MSFIACNVFLFRQTTDDRIDKRQTEFNSIGMNCAGTEHAKWKGNTLKNVAKWDCSLAMKLKVHSEWWMQIQLQKGPRPIKYTDSDTVNLAMLTAILGASSQRLSFSFSVSVCANQKIYVTHVRHYVCLHLQNGTYARWYTSRFFFLLYSHRWVSLCICKMWWCIKYTQGIPAYWETVRRCNEKTSNDCNEHWIFYVVHLNRHSFCSNWKEIMISRA